MKKILFIFALMLGMVSANAQIATQNSNGLDNVYFGLEFGAETPLNFNSVFPLNTVGGVKIGKEITPVIGVEVEGQVFFNENNFERWTSTAVKGTNVSLNGTVNLSNLFGGYLGTPRAFEVGTNVGLGWLYGWNIYKNDLTTKTALDFKFNLGKAKAVSIIVSPNVYWNLTASKPKVQFNKNFAQLGVMASFVYHFKTSNGTHHFKTYDIGAMNDEIARLQNELAKKPTEIIREKVITKEVVETKEVEKNETYIFFAYDDATLDNRAKATLDKISENGVYVVEAFASSEGSTEYNQRLSERRAAAVVDYLTKRGCKIDSWKGRGVQFGTTTGRVAVITSK